jgi:glc operon protein GlcG
MWRRMVIGVAGMAMVMLAAVNASAQMMPNPYGLAISGENARKAVQAALDVARKNNLKMAAAVVDPAGDLVYFDKVDGTQAASSDIAIDKARASARFKRPTKAFQDVLAAGGEGLRMLALRGAVPVGGGVPLLINGQIVGAIGLSGGTNREDELCADAGAAGFSK